MFWSVEKTVEVLSFERPLNEKLFIGLLKAFERARKKDLKAFNEKKKTFQMPQQQFKKRILNASNGF